MIMKNASNPNAPATPPTPNTAIQQGQLIMAGKAPANGRPLPNRNVLAPNAPFTQRLAAALGRQQNAPAPPPVDQGYKPTQTTINQGQYPVGFTPYPPGFTPNQQPQGQVLPPGFPPQPNPAAR